jgi:hypothetical protein
MFLLYNCALEKLKMKNGHKYLMNYILVYDLCLSRTVNIICWFMGLSLSAMLILFLADIYSGFPRVLHFFLASLQVRERRYFHMLRLLDPDTSRN